MAFFSRWFLLLMLAWLSMPAWGDDEEDAPTPPRLSYYKGDVAIYRPHEDAWEEVALNLPLAEGDVLDTGAGSRLELQLAGQAFIRADSYSRFQLAGQNLGGLRIEIESGRLSFDLRDLPEDDALVDVSVHGALITLERPGYYRFDIDQDIRLSVRQGGLATVIPANGETTRVHSAEVFWLSGEQVVAGIRAGELDQWDRWNLSRTDDLLAASSSRYLPSGIAGAYELDRYGSWTMTTAYGAVWAPYSVGPGWAPYSSGHWSWHPFYQWTWIDDAPWGWTPFHYGRWIYLGNRWVWAPGPLVHKPRYSPALVAFYYYGHQPCWVALGWGEPVMPWWGPPRWKIRPTWQGWGGPKIVNRKAVKAQDEISQQSIRYVNSQHRGALVATVPEQFGHRAMEKTPLTVTKPGSLRPAAGQLPQLRRELAVQPGAPSFAKAQRTERGVAKSSLPERIQRKDTISGLAKQIKPPARKAARSEEGRPARRTEDALEPSRMLAPPEVSGRIHAPAPIEQSAPVQPESVKSEVPAEEMRDIAEKKDAVTTKAQVRRSIHRENQVRLLGQRLSITGRNGEQEQDEKQWTRPRSTPYGLDSDARALRTPLQGYRLQKREGGMERGAAEVPSAPAGGSAQ